MKPPGGQQVVLFFLEPQQDFVTTVVKGQRFQWQDFLRVEDELVVFNRADQLAARVVAAHQLLADRVQVHGFTGIVGDCGMRIGMRAVVPCGIRLGK